MSVPISDDSTVTEVCTNLPYAEGFALGSGRGGGFPALSPEREEAILSILRNRLSSDKKYIQLSLLERYTRTCRKASVSHSPLPITGIKTCLYILKVATQQTDVATRQKLASVVEDWRNMLAQAVDPSLAGSQAVWTCKALRQVCGYEDELATLPSTNKRRRSLEGDEGGPNTAAPNSLPPAQRPRPSAPTLQLMPFSGLKSGRLSPNSPSIQEIRPKALGMPAAPVTLDSDGPDTGRPIAPDAGNSARSAPNNDLQAKGAEVKYSAVTDNPPSELQPLASSHTLCLETLPKHSSKSAAQDPLSQQASQPYSMVQGSITLPLRCIEPAPTSSNNLTHLSTQSALERSHGQSLVQSVPLTNQAPRHLHSQGMDKPSGQSSDLHTSIQLNSLGSKASTFDPWVQMYPQPLLPTIAPAVAPVTSSVVAQWEKAVRLLDLALTELIQTRPLPAPALLDSFSTFIPNPFSSSYLWTPQTLHSYACPIMLSSNGRSFTNFTSPLDKRIPTNAPVVTPQPHQQHLMSGHFSHVSTPTLAQSPQMMKRDIGLDRRLSQSSTQAPSSPAVSQSHADTQSAPPKQVASPPALAMSTSGQGSSHSQTGNDHLQGGQLVSMPLNNDLGGVPAAKSAHIPHVSEAQKAKFVETYKRVNLAGKMKLEDTFRKNNLWDHLSPLLSSLSDDLPNHNGAPASALNPQLSIKANSTPQHVSLPIPSCPQLPPASSGPATSLPNQAPVPEIQFLGQSSPRPINDSAMEPAPNAPRLNPPTMHSATPSSSTDPNSGLDSTLAKMLTAMLCNEPQSSAVLLTALSSLGIHNRVAILNHLKALAFCYSRGKDIMWKLREPSGPEAPAPQVRTTLQPSNKSASTPAPTIAALPRSKDHSEHHGKGTNSPSEAPNSTITGTSLPMNTIGNPPGNLFPHYERAELNDFQGKHTLSEKGKQPVDLITQATLSANITDRRPSAFKVSLPASVNNQQTTVRGQTYNESRVVNPWNQFQKNEMCQAVMRQDDRVRKNAPKEAIMGLLQEIHDKWKNMSIEEKEKFRQRTEPPAQVAVESFHPPASLSRPSDYQTPVSLVAKQQTLPTCSPPCDVTHPITDPSFDPGPSSSRWTGNPQALRETHAQQWIAHKNHHQNSSLMSAQVSRNGKEKMAVAHAELQVINLVSPNDETEISAQVAINGPSPTTQFASNKPLNGAKVSSNRSSPHIPRSKTGQSTWQANAFQDDLPGYPDVNPAFQVKGTRAKILARYPHNQQMPPIRTFAPVLVKSKTR